VVLLLKRGRRDCVEGARRLLREVSIPLSSGKREKTAAIAKTLKTYLSSATNSWERRERGGGVLERRRIHISTPSAGAPYLEEGEREGFF